MSSNIRIKKNSNVWVCYDYVKPKYREMKNYVVWIQTALYCT